jgi:hypothetical protein
MPVFNIKTFSEQKAESLARERLIATLSGFFGALALLLAAIGLYGVIAYAVQRRTREIGIRMSLGARSTALIWMVLRNALGMAFAGIGIGVSAELLSCQPGGRPTLWRQSARPRHARHCLPGPGRGRCSGSLRASVESLPR